MAGEAVDIMALADAERLVDRACGVGHWDEVSGVQWWEDGEQSAKDELITLATEALTARARAKEAPDAGA